MSKLQVKQQKEKNENNLRDLNTKPEKFLNKKWSRNDTLTNKLRKIKFLLILNNLKNLKIQKRISKRKEKKKKK